MSDPLAASLRAACDANLGNPRAMVEAVVSIKEVFGNDLIGNERFVATTTEWLTRFYEKGVLTSVNEAFA